MRINKCFFSAAVLLVLVLMTTTSFAKTLVVGVEPSFPPWAYVKDGKFQGMAVDGMRAVAKDQGLDIKFKDMTFSALIPALMHNKIDVMVSGIIVTKKRAKAVDFTIPWFESNDAIIVPEDSDKNLFSAICCDANVGVQNGSTQQSWLKDNVTSLKGFDTTLKSYDDYVVALEDMLAGRLDSVVTAETTAAEFISNKRPIKVVGTIDLHVPLAIAVKKGDPQKLLPILNKGIKAMGDNGDWAEIVHKHLPGISVPSIPAHMPDWVDTYKKPVPGLSEE